MNSALTIVLAAVLHLACAGEPARGRSQDEREPITPSGDSLRPSHVFGSRDTWGSISNLQVVDSLLFVYDRLADPRITVIAWGSGRTVVAFGRAGRGPGEFLHMTSVTAAAAANHFWIFDGGLRRLSRYDLSTSPPQLVETRLIDQPWRIRTAALTEGGMLMTGVFEDRPVRLTDSAGRAVRATLGAFPASLSRTPAIAAVNGMGAASSPDGRRVGIAYRYWNVVQLYDLADGTMVEGAPINPYVPTWEMPRPEHIPPVMTYGFPAATDRHLYALWCGCNHWDVPAEERDRPVHVYGWDGSPVADLALPRGGGAIAVTPDDRWLYVDYEEPYPQVRAFRLPAFPKRPSEPALPG